jgi:small subunit ribosomal protein S15
MAVKDPTKPDTIQKFQAHAKDTGSTEVQVAIYTGRIRHLTEHLKKYPKDHATRRGLLQLVGRQKSLLRYLARRKPAQYRELVGRLGLRG